MPKRVCACCGKERDISGGKICEKGHFICRKCNSGRAKCPICKSKLS